MTEKLYDVDSYLSSFTATVLACLPAGNEWDIVLNRTAFFPEGGGQYGDVGTLGGIPVTDTQIKDNLIFHHTAVPLEVGKIIVGQVDFTTRFRRMQHHSGEHILSGLVCRLYGYENVGFHLSDKEMTMDYNGLLSAEDVERIEALANRTVWESRTVSCTFPSSEELTSLEYRSKKALEGPIRIVTVEGIDTCACCAPHVRKTGEIGGIYITDAIHWKGGMRLTACCGEKALDEYKTLRRDEKQLSSLFSAPAGQIATAAEKMKAEYEALRRRHNEVLKENLSFKLEKLPFTEGNLCFFFDGDSDLLRAAANLGAGKCTGLFVALAGADGEGYRYVISSQIPCLRGKAKEINAALSGRGGGSDQMIQGSFLATQTQIRDYFKEFTV